MELCDRSRMLPGTSETSGDGLRPKRPASGGTFALPLDRLFLLSNHLGDNKKILLVLSVTILAYFGSRRRRLSRGDPLRPSCCVAAAADCCFDDQRPPLRGVLVRRRRLRGVERGGAGGSSGSVRDGVPDMERKRLPRVPLFLVPLGLCHLRDLFRREDVVAARWETGEHGDELRAGAPSPWSRLRRHRRPAMPARRPDRCPARRPARRQVLLILAIPTCRMYMVSGSFIFLVISWRAVRYDAARQACSSSDVPARRPARRRAAPDARPDAAAGRPARRQSRRPARRGYSSSPDPPLLH